MHEKRSPSPSKVKPSVELKRSTARDSEITDLNTDALKHTSSVGAVQDADKRTPSRFAMRVAFWLVVCLTMILVIIAVQTVASPIPKPDVEKSIYDLSADLSEVVIIDAEEVSQDEHTAREASLVLTDEEIQETTQPVLSVQPEPKENEPEAPEFDLSSLIDDGVSEQDSVPAEPVYERPAQLPGASPNLCGGAPPELVPYPSFSPSEVERLKPANNSLTEAFEFESGTERKKILPVYRGPQRRRLLDNLQRRGSTNFQCADPRSNRCKLQMGLIKQIRNMKAAGRGIHSQFIVGSKDEKIDLLKVKSQLRNGHVQDGWVLVKNAGCRLMPARVHPENLAPKGRAPPPSVKEDEEAVVQCANNPLLCVKKAMTNSTVGSEEYNQRLYHFKKAVYQSARKLAGVMTVVKGAKDRGPMGELLKKRFDTCALVGNGGSLLKGDYGQYIDSHQVVVRFNLAANQQWAKQVGRKTTYMMIGHRPSVDLCCPGQQPALPYKAIPGAKFLMWTPPGEVSDEIIGKCKSKHKGIDKQLVPMTWEHLGASAQTMRVLRKDMLRLGLGSSFSNWMQLTSGAHAILLFSKLCKTVSVYGFTSWAKMNMDQYWGRKERIKSGNVYHDWGMEGTAWKVLHAAGVVNMCTP